MSEQTNLQVEVSPFFDEDSNTFSYVVKDPLSKHCAIVDPVLGFDYASGSISHEGADDIIEFVNDQGLIVDWIIETHIHADHLSAAPYLQSKVGGKLGVGEHITVVQKTFGEIFNEGPGFEMDGSQFDCLFKDGQTYKVGEMTCKALHTPGHTPACMTHLMGDAVFVGDTLFMPDAGTARADFPGGNAATLFDSVQKILGLPAQSRVFMCHDYCPNDRAIEFQTSIEQQRENNIHVNKTVKKLDFIAMREARDKTLGMPRLILPSLQVNMRAGHFPDKESNGLIYLKVPVNAFNKATGSI